MIDQMSNPVVLEAIRVHAIADYPREACGVVLEDGYHPLLNHSPTPEEAFECTLQLAPLLLQPGRVQALVHSHPNGPNNPSAYDMCQQAAMDVPWGICPCLADAALPTFFWYEDFPPPPLEGRDFRFGPSGSDGRGDCAALVRDYYWLKRGIRLKEFHRDAQWFQVPGASYRNNLLEAGFVPVSADALEIGDVFLASILMAMENHAGVYVGNGRILHHLINRLSREDSAVGWLRCITGWYRYAGE